MSKTQHFGVMFRRCIQTATRSTRTPLTEPDAPLVRTAIPGPRSLDLLKQLDAIQATQSIEFFVDYDRSYGNYIVDADDNHILDCYTQIASAPLGYNHPAIVESFNNPSNRMHYVNRPALGNFPSVDWPRKLEDSLMSIAPEGMGNVTTMGCGACAVEHAIKAVCMAYKRWERNGAAPTQKELDFSVINKQPVVIPTLPTREERDKRQPGGRDELTILSFSNAFHGRTTGALACTHTKWMHKLDFPTFDWPIADFPQLKYPLDENEGVNRREEDRCLQHVRNQIHDYRFHNKPVVAAIVEPIQGEGGDKHATPYFFTQLQQILKENNAFLIVDEVQSGGGATGEWWHHESWNLPSPPDVVTFSKKMLTGGFYHTDEMRPTDGYRIFNTWMGDPARLIQLEAFVNTVNEDNLFPQVQEVGKQLVEGMTSLQEKFLQINSARGLGVLCAVDAKNTEYRNKLLHGLKTKGISCGGNGTKTLRLRPSLIFKPKHAEIFLDRFEQVLHEN